MKQISFICCYTKPELLEKLVSSLSSYQSYRIEWILVDNTQGRYSSAASALNAGTEKSTTDILVFLHQDIEFDAEKTLDLICQEVENGKIVGVAGRKIDGGPLVTSITDGQNAERPHAYPFKSSCEEVLACDECLIAVSREVFDRVRGFNEKDFDGWHFYGVDFCLRAKEMGISSCVVPSKLWHKSKGSHDKTGNGMRKSSGGFTGKAIG